MLTDVNCMLTVWYAQDEHRRPTISPSSVHKVLSTVSKMGGHAKHARCRRKAPRKVSSEMQAKKNKKPSLTHPDSVQAVSKLAQTRHFHVQSLHARDVSDPQLFLQCLFELTTPEET